MATPFQSPLTPPNLPTPGRMIRTRFSRQTTLQKVVANPYLAEAELCRRDFYYFMQKFWPEYSSDPFIPNWHIPYLCYILRDMATRVSQLLPKRYDLIINIPPGTTKTATCMIFYPVWCWINWFWMRFITSSYSAALSLESAEYSRDLMRSQKFSEIFPDLVIKQDKDSKSNFRVQKRSRKHGLKTGGSRYSTSVGGTLTGFHGHILLVDDPLDPNRAFSQVELANANRWMDQTLPTRKVEKSIAPTILIMQRLHENDPTGNWLSKKKENVRHISLPGEIRTYKDQVRPPELITHYKDDLLDPSRMGWGVLEEMEQDLGQYGYAGQVGQNPTPPGGGMFKTDHFQIEDHMPNVKIAKQVRYWDKAATKENGGILIPGKGARTAGVKMYLLENGKFVVVDAKAGRWETDEREDVIRETAEADGREVPIELEREPGSGGKDSANASIKNLAGFVAHDDRPTGDKVYRADPWSVQVNRGNVILLRAPWNDDYIREHRFFPMGTLKDLVDASSGAFKYLTDKRKRAGTW